MSRAGLFLLLALPTLAAAQPPPRLDRFGDPLPPGAIARLGTVRLRQGASVCRTEFFPDGKMFASRGEDGIIRLWDVATGRQVRAFRKQGKSLRCFALASDGKTLATAVSGNSPEVILLWETATGRQVGALRGDPDLRVWGMAFSADGRLLAATGEHSQEAFVWDLSTQKMLRGYEARGELYTLAFSKDGRHLAALGSGTVLLWDREVGAHRQLEHGSAWIREIASLPQSGLLATVDGDGVVRFWDFATGKAARRGAIYADTPPRAGFGAAFSADGRVLVMERDNGRISVWDLDQGRRLQTFRGPRRGLPVLALAPDGSTLATQEGGALRLWDVRTGKERLPLAGHRAPVRQLVYLDGRTLASVGADEATRLWDIPAGKQLRALPAGVLAPDGSALASLDDGTLLRLTDTATGKLTILFQEHRDEIRRLAFSPCGQKAASVDNSAVFYLWERDTGRPIHRLPLPEEMEKERDHLWITFRFSDDGKTLFAQGVFRGLCSVSYFASWNTATGRILQSSRRDGSAATVSPDLKILARFEDHDALGERLLLEEVQTGRPLRRFPWADPKLPNRYRSELLTFSPDGRLLTAPATRADRLSLFEVATGKLVYTLQGRGGAITSAHFSPDGRSLITLAEDSTLQVWEVAAGQERCRFRGHQGAVRSLAFSPDGRTLATGGDDTTVLVWDLTGLPTEKRKPSPQELQAAWDDLGSTDAARAYRAVWKLADAADQSVPLLRQRLRLSHGPDPRRLQGLLRDLDNDDFAVREKAHGQLQRLGVLAEDTLRKELANGPSAEVQQRIRRLLAGMSRYPFTAEQVAQLRVLEVLEYAGSADARQLLRRLADEMAAPLNQEARAALERMTHPLPGTVPAQPLAPP